MKKYLKSLFSFFTAIALFTIVGCEKVENNTLAATGNVAITSVSPGAEFPEETVTLQGVDFNQVQFLFLDEVQVDFQLSGEDLTFVIPAGTTPGMKTITLAMAQNYRVTSQIEVLLRPVPVIQDFDAYVAPGGDLVITGLSFNPEYNVEVFIDGMSAPITAQTNTSLTVTVPAGVPDDEPLDLEITSIHGSTTASTAFIARESLVENSTLSEGSGDDFTGWEKKNGGDGMTEVTGSEAYGGGRSMRVEGSGTADAWRTQLGSSFTVLTVGEEYTAMLWAKSEEAGGQMRVSVSEWNNSNGDDFFYGDTYEIGTSWQLYTWTFTAQATVNGDHRLVLDMGHTPVPLLIDHIAIVEGAFGGSSEAPTLIANGGFEEGIGTAWEVSNGDITETSDPDQVHCGSNAIRVVGDGAGDGWRTQIIADGVELTEGEEYVIRLWAKAEGPDGEISVSVSRWMDSNGDDYFYSDPVVVTAGEWNEYSWTFTAGTTSNGVHNVVLDLGRSAQTYYIDDVSLKENVPPTNILDPDNAGFENGIDGGWEVSNGDITLTTDPAQVYEGTSAIHVVGDGAGDGWRTQIIADGVELTEGNNYGIKLMAMAEGPDGEISVSVSRWMDSNGDDYFYSDPVVVAEEWTEYTWTFTAGTTSNGVHNVVLDLGRSAQTYYIDNVILYEIPEFECE